MKLKTDNRSRLTSRELFKPDTAYEAAIDQDGVIKLMESVPQAGVASREVKPVRRKGRLMLPVKLSREEIRRAIRADRDSR